MMEYLMGGPALAASVIGNFDTYLAGKKKGYTEEDLKDAYEAGYRDGVASVPKYDPTFIQHHTRQSPGPQ